MPAYRLTDKRGRDSDHETRVPVSACIGWAFALLRRTYKILRLNMRPSLLLGYRYKRLIGRGSPLALPFRVLRRNGYCRPCTWLGRRALKPSVCVPRHACRCFPISLSLLGWVWALEREIDTPAAERLYLREPYPLCLVCLPAKANIARNINAEAPTKL
jgi:hypothetical protein